MAAYYNENDSFAAQWLRNLISRGLISPGDVDERSIEDVTPADLAGYSQHHFFAGIGGWSYALRLAGWEDDRPAWTGSCPCQPFSAAGARKGVDDERHLWPHWRWLIDQCRPIAVFGEQVASKDGREWLAGVRADLDVLGYAVGAADLCAASVGAPHIRQRLWWLADADWDGRARHIHDGPAERGIDAGADARDGRSANGGLADAGSPQRERREDERRSHSFDAPERDEETTDDQRCSTDGGLGNADNEGPQERRERLDEQHVPQGREDAERSAGLSGGTWGDAAWLPCADGKSRRIKPGIEPLAHGIPSRVGMLRGYGNAIVPQVGAEFVRAFVELRNEGLA